MKTITLMFSLLFTLLYNFVIQLMYKWYCCKKLCVIVISHIIFCEIHHTFKNSVLYIVQETCKRGGGSEIPFDWNW